MDGVCDEVWGAVAPAPTRADGLVALVAKFVAQKESKGRRARSVEDLKYRLGLLTAYLGDLSARAVTLDDLEAALAKVPGVARSKINARTVWRNFFRWCWRRGAVSEPDLVRKLEPPSAPRGLPKVATAWRLWRLVAAAWHDGGTRRAPGEMLAYALMTFGSAVRPQEFCRLTWPMVNLTDALLPLDEHVTKVSMIPQCAPTAGDRAGAGEAEATEAAAGVFLAAAVGPDPRARGTDRNGMGGGRRSPYVCVEPIRNHQ